MNLNLESYSKHDLMKLFSLKPGFDSKCVQTGKDKLTRQLRRAPEIDTQKKLDIQFFIDNATSLLIGFIEDELNVSREKGTWMQKKNTMMPPNNTHFVIANHNTEAMKRSVIRTNSSLEVPHGWLNPINVRTISTCMNIDSRFRNLDAYPSSSEFQVDFDDVQKNVIRTKVIGIDIPTTFYGVSRERGDATLIITEIEQRSSLNMKDNPNNELPIDKEHSSLNYNNQTGQWSQEFVQQVLKLHPCFSRIAVNTIPKIHYLINESDPNNLGVYSVSDVSNWQSDTFFKNPVFSFGWLIVMPDGNYECIWQESNNSADLVYSMNNALSLAIPGILFHSAGQFLTYGIDSKKPMSTVNYGINTTYDLMYDVDRKTGKSTFNIPDILESVFITGKHITSELNYPPNYDTEQWSGFNINFAVNSGGSISLAENIQLRLGWQLGFREADYRCDETTLLVSEGVAMILSPRYIFLAIDDGLKNSSVFIATTAQSSLREHVMTKINTTQEFDNSGAYKIMNNIFSNNLPREYFGPGTISRIKVKIVDEHGRIVSLNNMDWSMNIVFTKLYE